MRRELALASVLLLMSACAGRSEYQKAMHSADARLERRDLEGTLAEWTRAGDVAENDDDKVEALYRAARLKAELGRSTEAISELNTLLQRFPKTSRAPRILMDLGRLEERSDHVELAKSHYRELLKRYPTSGNATSALERLLDLAGPSRRNENEAFQKSLQDPDLLSYLRFSHAEDVAETDPLAGALEFEQLAKAEPLPKGSYTDEALLKAAKLRIRRSEFAEAKTNLEQLLPPIENAWLVGSYKRKAYADGVFLLGVLTAKGMSDRESARRHFEFHISAFPESIARDDVEYELALLDAAEKGVDAGCVRVTELLKRDPHSRFRRCRDALCSGSPGEPICAGASLSIDEAP